LDKLRVKLTDANGKEVTKKVNKLEHIDGVADIEMVKFI